MLSSAAHPFFTIPFANAAASTEITYPIPSASLASTGKASLTDGFPPKNFLPDAAGGVAPFGQDINGILKEITENIRWMQAGGISKYDSTFSTAIGGYPSGAVLLTASSTGFWVSKVDNNTSNPDANGANWVKMDSTYLDYSVAGTGSVTMLASDATYDIIDFVGALTGNRVVVLPQADNQWIFKNSTTGNYSLTVAMATGAQIILLQGTSTGVFSDAVDLEYSAQTCATAPQGDNSTRIANTEFVNSVLTGKTAYASVTLSGTATYNLSTVEANHFVINLVGNLTGPMLVLVPAATAGNWTFRNSTAGGFAVTVNISGGATAVPLPALQNTSVISTGTAVYYESETAATAPAGNSSLTIANTAFVQSVVTGVNTYIDIPIQNGATSFTLTPAQQNNLIIDFAPVVAAPLGASVLITIQVGGTPASARKWTFRNSYSPNNFGYTMTIQTDKPNSRQIVLQSTSDTILVTDGNNLSYAVETVDTQYYAPLSTDSSLLIANTKFVQDAIAGIHLYKDIVITSGTSGYTLTADDIKLSIIDFVPSGAVTSNLSIVIPVSGLATDANEWVIRNSFPPSAFSVTIKTNRVGSRVLPLHGDSDTIIATDGNNVSFACESVDTQYYTGITGTDNSKLIANTQFVQEALAGAAAGVGSFSAGSTGLTPSTATTGPVTLSGTLAVANGGTGGTTATGSGAMVKAISPTLTGTPIAPTAAVKTVNTQIATTAFASGSLVFPPSVATDMYQIFPSGLVMQWGTGLTDANGLLAITFPLAMTGIMNSTGLPTLATGQVLSVGATGFTPTGITYRINNSTNGTPAAGVAFHWSVVGYL